MFDDSPQDPKYKGDGGHTDAGAADNAEPIMVTIEPQVKNKHSYEAKNYRLDRARYRLEKKAYCAAKWTMIFLIAYTALTLVVALTSVIGTVNTNRLLRATNAGVLKPELGLSRDTINLTFHNIGKGSVRKIAAKYRITWEHLPDESPIWASEWKSYAAAVEQAGEGEPNETIIPGFRIPEDWNAYIHSQTAIKVDGTAGYSDGFDNIPTHPFCIMTTGGGMIQCDGLAVYLHSLPPQH
jgi:hypothetical protein